MESIMKKRMIKGIIILVVIGGLDLAKTGMFQQIQSLSDLGNLSYQDILYYGIIFFVRLYGIYLFVSAIIFMIREKKKTDSK